MPLDKTPAVDDENTELNSLYTFPPDSLPPISKARVIEEVPERGQLSRAERRARIFLLAAHELMHQESWKKEDLRYFLQQAINHEYEASEIRGLLGSLAGFARRRTPTGMAHRGVRDVRVEAQKIAMEKLGESLERQPVDWEKIDKKEKVVLAEEEQAALAREDEKTALAREQGGKGD